MNVQQTIIKGIKEQLFLNDYLVLPNFGGFVLKSSPSHFSASGGLLIPPSKTVTFNIQLKQNDGILAIWLQNTLSCTSNEALIHLKDFSEFCTGILNAKRRITLEGIGFFYLDFENNVCFEPQQDSNFLTRSFGLAPVSIREIEPEATESKKESTFIDRVPGNFEISEVKPKTLQGPAIKRDYRKLVTPVMFGIIFICLLGLLVSNSKIQGELRASLFSNNPSGAYKPYDYPDLNAASIPEKKTTYVADANGIAIIKLDAEKSLAVRVIENTNAKHIKTFHPNKVNHHSNKFEIVLGCFNIHENASRMVHSLSAQNIQAVVSGKNAKGMYVVSNGSFDSKEDAVQRLLEIKDSFPHAWIKKGE